MTGVAWIDGRQVPLDEAAIPLTDRGFLLGDGLFETMRTYRGRVYRLHEHMQRLRHGLQVLGWDEAVAADVEQALIALASADHGHQVVRGMVTSGPGPAPDDPVRPTVTALARPLEAPAFRDGIAIVAAAWRKSHDDPLAGIKGLSYLEHMHARRQARAVHADDAYFYDRDGHVVEATTANIFARVGDLVHAPGPEAGALDGVTRRVLLDILGDEDVAIAKEIPSAAWDRAEEVWLSNTTGGAVPVTRIDGRTVGDGTPGELTQRLFDAYEKDVRGD